MVAFLRGHLAFDGPARDLEVHHPDHRLEQRRLHPLALTRALALVQRDEDAEREVEAGGEVRHRDAHARRLGARQPGDAHQPAHALRDLVDATALGVRARLPEAGDRAEHDAWVAGVDRLVVEAEARLHRRAHVLDQDVGGVDQPEQQLTPLFRLEVEGQRALVAVEVLEVGAAAGAEDRARVLGVHRHFDPDHVGAPVGELPDARRPGARDRQVDDADVVEREHPVGHRVLPTLDT